MATTTTKTPEVKTPEVVNHHSLTNKQLFNFSENPRPEVVFIGVNYVTFISGYDPSANLSGVLLVLVIQQNFSAHLLNNDFARAIPTCYRSVLK